MLPRMCATVHTQLFLYTAVLMRLCVFYWQDAGDLSDGSVDEMAHILETELEHTQPTQLSSSHSDSQSNFACVETQSSHANVDPQRQISSENSTETPNTGLSSSHESVLHDAVKLEPWKTDAASPASSEEPHLPSSEVINHPDSPEVATLPLPAQVVICSEAPVAMTRQLELEMTSSRALSITSVIAEPPLSSCETINHPDLSHVAISPLLPQAVICSEASVAMTSQLELQKTSSRALSSASSASVVDEPPLSSCERSNDPDSSHVATLPLPPQAVICSEASVAMTSQLELETASSSGSDEESLPTVVKLEPLNSEVPVMAVSSDSTGDGRNSQLTGAVCEPELAQSQHVTATTAGEDSLTPVVTEEALTALPNHNSGDGRNLQLTETVFEPKLAQPYRMTAAMAGGDSLPVPLTPVMIEEASAAIIQQDFDGRNLHLTQIVCESELAESQLVTTAIASDDGLTPVVTEEALTALPNKDSGDGRHSQLTETIGESELAQPQHVTTASADGDSFLVPLTPVMSEEALTALPNQDCGDGRHSQLTETICELELAQPQHVTTASAGGDSFVETVTEEALTALPNQDCGDGRHSQLTETIGELELAQPQHVTTASAGGDSFLVPLTPVMSEEALTALPNKDCGDGRHSQLTETIGESELAQPQHVTTASAGGDSFLVPLTPVMSEEALTALPNQDCGDGRHSQLTDTICESELAQPQHVTTASASGDSFLVPLTPVVTEEALTALSNQDSGVGRNSQLTETVCESVTAMPQLVKPHQPQHVTTASAGGDSFLVPLTPVVSEEALTALPNQDSGDGRHSQLTETICESELAQPQHATAASADGDNSSEGVGVGVNSGVAVHLDRLMPMLQHGGFYFPVIAVVLQPSTISVSSITTPVQNPEITASRSLVSLISKQYHSFVNSRDNASSNTHVSVASLVDIVTTLLGDTVSVPSVSACRTLASVHDTVDSLASTSVAGSVTPMSAVISHVLDAVNSVSTVVSSVLTMSSIAASFSGAAETSVSTTVTSSLNTPISWTSTASTVIPQPDTIQPQSHGMISSSSSVPCTTAFLSMHQTSVMSKTETPVFAIDMFDNSTLTAEISENVAAAELCVVASPSTAISHVSNVMNPVPAVLTSSSLLPVSSTVVSVPDAIASTAVSSLDTPISVTSNVFSQPNVMSSVLWSLSSSFVPCTVVFTPSVSSTSITSLMSDTAVSMSTTVISDTLTSVTQFSDDTALAALHLSSQAQATDTKLCTSLPCKSPCISAACDSNGPVRLMDDSFSEDDELHIVLPDDSFLDTQPADDNRCKADSKPVESCPTSSDPPADDVLPSDKVSDSGNSCCGNSVFPGDGVVLRSSLKKSLPVPEPANISIPASVFYSNQSVVSVSDGSSTDSMPSVTDVLAETLLFRPLSPVSSCQQCDLCDSVSKVSQVRKLRSKRIITKRKLSTDDDDDDDNVTPAKISAPSNRV